MLLCALQFCLGEALMGIAGVWLQLMGLLGGIKNDNKQLLGAFGDCYLCLLGARFDLAGLLR